MSRIEKKFAELRKRGETALIPFVFAGDPDLETTFSIMRALEKGGAELIALGIPFSLGADQRRRSGPAGRAQRAWFRILCFSDRRDRRAPLIRCQPAHAGGPGGRGHLPAGGRW